MDTREFSKNVKLIPTHQIKPSPENPRGVVSEDGSFERLVSSIAEVGILVPIVVRELGPERFQLVDGERRYMAARKLRVSRVPAHVLSGAVEKRHGNSGDPLRSANPCRRCIRRWSAASHWLRSKIGQRRLPKRHG